MIFGLWNTLNNTSFRMHSLYEIALVYNTLTKIKAKLHAGINKRNTIKFLHLMTYSTINIQMYYCHG